MRTFLTSLLSVFVFIFLSAADSYNGGYRYIPVDAFSEGEKLHYRVHYGFVTGGEATMVIDKNLHEVNGRQCYKIDVHGHTTGLVDKLFNVKNTWGTYLDTAAIVPQKSYRYIREGRYRKNEEVVFNQLKGKASLIEYDKKGKKVEKTEEYLVPGNVQDMVSGYYFLRTLDYDDIRKGEILKIESFFDGELYDFQVRFVGREKIETKLGEFNTLVLQPIMPENDLFDGEDAIKVWLSDDKHKIPLKIQADMLVGAIQVDLKELPELKN